MAIHFHVCPKRRLAFFRMVGTVKTPECVDAFFDYTKHPEFNPEFPFLTTTENMTRIESNFRQVVQAVQRTKPLFSPFRKESLCVIHAPGHLSFGMARILQQVIEPVSNFRLEITRNPAEALSLAGQPERNFDALEAALGVCVLSD